SPPSSPRSSSRSSRLSSDGWHPSGARNRTGDEQSSLRDVDWAQSVSVTTRSIVGGDHVQYCRYEANPQLSILRRRHRLHHRVRSLSVRPLRVRGGVLLSRRHRVLGVLWRSARLLLRLPRPDYLSVGPCTAPLIQPSIDRAVALDAQRPCIVSHPL